LSPYETPSGSDEPQNQHPGSKPQEPISLILPVYNEENSVYAVIKESVRTLRLLGRDYQIVAVDDGSSDGTAAQLLRAASDFGRVSIVTLTENQGKGNALKRGFQASDHPLVCFLDADLDLSPYQIKRFISEMERTGADVVIGSKRHPQSQLEYPRSRRLYSTVYYFLIHMLFRLPVRDTQTGIKLFKREVLLRVFPLLVSMQYALDLELLLIANYKGYEIVEAPVRINFQSRFGRITWADIRGIIIDTMSIFYRFYVLGYYGSPLKPIIPDEPKVSIVIPARTIDGMVEECVSKCGELNYSNFDIKIVTDEAAEMELPGRGSRVIPSGPVGPAVKRNIGVSDSDAALIAFIDGDAYPDFDWLKNAVPYFEDDKVAAVGGPAVTPPGDNRRKQASGVIFASTLISDGTRYRYRPHAFRKVDDYPTVNLLVRRSDFRAVGGFHEEFWPGEDTVLCLRLTGELDKHIVYVPNVMVNHHRRAVFVPHLKQVYSYGLHRGFFVKKFPETSKRLKYFVPSLFVLAIIAGAVGSIFSEIVLVSYVSVLALYLGLAFFSSIKTQDILINLMAFVGMPLTHLTYGAGFLFGLIRRRMKEQ
jgi:glycosyltransferase involved in cell wall biosynthesis